MKIDLTTVLFALLFVCGLLAIDSVTAGQTGAFAESLLRADGEYPDLTCREQNRTSDAIIAPAENRL